MAEEKPPTEQHELLIVVLGEHQSGKTSVIDRLLGLDESSLPRKRTLFFKRREGQAGGRKVVMVDTPGWWRSYPLMDMAEIMKLKLVLSLPRPPCGPHAFLLTIVIDESFDEKNRKSVEEHLELFGDSVWEHTIVMFTRGESLEGKTIEQHIESEGKALQCLLEKCGNQYCIFDNQARDQSNVIQLLEKVDSVLLRNSGRQFELNENIFKEADEKRTAIKERSQTRLLRMTEHNKKNCRDQSLPMTEIRILLVGWV
ncbi:GTPase IMAP family member 7-like [Engraulis encrasicolus]|uniref:GTPase IMAP family member 7-like n=1 Tax=Engraulis encrasicolus TaxID=184585 RepID=UPI002FD3170A